MLLAYRVSLALPQESMTTHNSLEEGELQGFQIRHVRRFVCRVRVNLLYQLRPVRDYVPSS
jgi:hypothetical protein